MSSGFFSLQGKASKKIHAILTETLDCFPVRAKDLPSALYFCSYSYSRLASVSCVWHLNNVLKRRRPSASAASATCNCHFYKQVAGSAFWLPPFFWPFILPVEQFGVTIHDCVRELLASNIVVTNRPYWIRGFPWFYPVLPGMCPRWWRMSIRPRPFPFRSFAVHVTSYSVIEIYWAADSR